MELTHDYWHNFVSLADEIKLCNIEEEIILEFRTDMEELYFEIATILKGNIKMTQK